MGTALKERKLHDLITEAESVPIASVSARLCRIMSKYLDVPDRIRHNDWHGLADRIDLTMMEVRRVEAQGESPTYLVMCEFCKRKDTLAKLLNHLTTMQRMDLLLDDDFLKALEANIKYSKAPQSEKNSSISGTTILTQFERSKPPSVRQNDQPEMTGITRGEVMTGQIEHFDAFVGYAQEDFPFVRELISQLENDSVYNLKLCVNARDLIAGGAEHMITAKLIEERCKRIILVMSPDFIRCEICDFYVKFAHSLSPGSRSKKIIPVLVKNCTIPSILRYITLIDRTKPDLQEWFWDRLGRSLQAPLEFHNDLERMATEDLSKISYTSTATGIDRSLDARSSQGDVETSTTSCFSVTGGTAGQVNSTVVGQSRAPHEVV